MRKCYKFIKRGFRMFELKMNNKCYNIQNEEDIKNAIEQLENDKSNYLSDNVRTDRTTYNPDCTTDFKEKIYTFEAMGKMLKEILFYKK